MKKIALITLMLAVGFSVTTAQKKQAKPEEKSIVNKEFDENGNLIKYDSTFVWNWSGDSVFQSDSTMKDFLDFGEIFSDSAFLNHFGHGIFNFEPFENDEFFGQFEHQFPDSAFSKHFDFFGDSALVFPFEFGDNLNKEFFSKDFEKLHKELQQQLDEMQSPTPRFESEKQRKAWEELMKKQQNEQMELLKKWKEN